MKKQISYKAAFSFGFSSFIDNIFTFFMLWIISIVLLGIVGMIKVLFFAHSLVITDMLKSLSSFFTVFATPTEFTISLLAFFFGILVLYEAYHYQLVRFALAIYEGRPLSWKQLFVFSWKPFSTYCVARLVRGFLIAVGSCLLYIPGFYWMCKYYFAGYSLIEGTNEKVSEDRIYSRQLTHDVHWQILGFALVVQLCTIAISLTAMFALPIIYLATVHAYKQLQQQEPDILAEKNLSH
jgi:hypothetical protein